MDPPASHRVSRVRRYSGATRRGSGFAYGAVTRSGRPSQAVPLARAFVTAQCVVPQPRRGLRARRFDLGPRSLATTRGISLDFSSSGYLDVSVPRVASPGPMCSGRGCHGMARGGFSHSETRGSKGVCPSPRIIAACRVLRRLPVPRHPPHALAIFLRWHALIHTKVN